MITLLAATTFAASPDVALSTRVEGVVTLSSAEGATPLVPFAKLRRGDVLALPASAHLDLVYFDDGRTESFVGPLRLVVGEATQPASVVEGDALVGDALRGLPALARRAEVDKGGHTLVRGARTAPVPLDDEDRALLQAARARAEGLASSAGGVLPQLYLASVLLELDQVDEARAELAKAASRCAACVPEALREAVASGER